MKKLVIVIACLFLIACGHAAKECEITIYLERPLDNMPIEPYPEWKTPLPFNDFESIIIIESATGDVWAAPYVIGSVSFFVVPKHIEAVGGDEQNDTGRDR